MRHYAGPVRTALSHPSKRGSVATRHGDETGRGVAGNAHGDSADATQRSSHSLLESYSKLWALE
jgi:hypothetical protein